MERYIQEVVVIITWLRSVYLFQRVFVSAWVCGLCLCLWSESESEALWSGSMAPSVNVLFGQPTRCQWRHGRVAATTHPT